VANVINAREAGICGVCLKKFSIGTRIAIDKKTGRWAEADCLWPDKKKREVTKTIPETEEGNVEVKMPAWPTSLDLKENELIRKSILDIRELLPGLDDDVLIPMFAMQYKAYLQKQEQEFSIGVSKRIEYTKYHMVF